MRNKYLSDCLQYYHIRIVNCVGNISPAMGARNQVGIGYSYRTDCLCSLVTQFQTLFLELIPRPITGLKFSTLYTNVNRTVELLKLYEWGGEGGGARYPPFKNHLAEIGFSGGQFFMTGFLTSLYRYMLPCRILQEFSLLHF